MSSIYIKTPLNKYKNITNFLIKLSNNTSTFKLIVYIIQAYLVGYIIIPIIIMFWFLYKLTICIIQTIITINSIETIE